MMIDSNLTFLQYCTNEDLRSLCDILTHNHKGEVRLSEQLTYSDCYKHCYPDNMQEMWSEIAEELQKFGGNTFANMLRGGTGASYESILHDVCKKMKVNLPSPVCVEEAEQLLLMKYCEKAIGMMDLNLLRELSAEIGVEPKNYNQQMLAATILIALRYGGGKLLGLVVYYIGANIGRILAGRGLYFAAGGVLGRAFGIFTGPLGWAITAGWLALDIASPAYRVTIPAVLMVACLRTKFNSHILTAHCS